MEEKLTLLFAFILKLFYGAFVSVYSAEVAKEFDPQAGEKRGWGRLEGGNEKIFLTEKDENFESDLQMQLHSVLEP